MGSALWMTLLLLASMSLAWNFSFFARRATTPPRRRPFYAESLLFLKERLRVKKLRWIERGIAL